MLQSNENNLQGLGTNEVKTFASIQRNKKIPFPQI